MLGDIKQLQLDVAVPALCPGPIDNFTSYEYLARQDLHSETCTPTMSIQVVCVSTILEGGDRQARQTVFAVTQLCHSNVAQAQSCTYLALSLSNMVALSCQGECQFW